MEEADWRQFSQWHLLFDELCNRAGFYDDATLAGAYCTLTQSKGQKQFETTVRNLNNWRSGRHVPRAGNLRILSRLLDIAGNPELQVQWNELYKRAKDLEVVRPAASGSPLPVVSRFPASGYVDLPATTSATLIPTAYYGFVARPKRWSHLQALLGGLVLLCIGVAAGAVLGASGWRPWAGPADNAPIIAFNPKIDMKVGESRPIYAERSDCGKLPRDWAEVRAELPFARTGEFSDGGLARRFSKFCKGLTPARAIVFTATKAGIEEFEIQGDFFKMTVTPP